MRARWLALLALVAGGLSGALGLAGLVVAVATGGGAGVIVTGFLSGAAGFGLLALVSVLLEIAGGVREDVVAALRGEVEVPKGTGKRRA